MWTGSPEGQDQTSWSSHSTGEDVCKQISNWTWEISPCSSKCYEEVKANDDRERGRRMRMGEGKTTSESMILSGAKKD